MALCKEQKAELASKLIVFIKDLTNDEIDEIVADAKQRVNSEISEEKKIRLKELFESQLNTLKSLETPQTILDVFHAKKKEVIATAAKMAFKKGNIPFLPVIPRSYMGINALIAMVKHGDTVGHTHLDSNELIDVVETPSAPYYVFDVENGEATIGKSPIDAEEIINHQNRSCLILDEVIALGVHTKILSDHNVDATGSRCRLGNVPDLCLCDGIPELNWDHPDGSSYGWGSGSCGSRL